ncbi:MAG: ester cyclase [Chloroflexi bacterium]|nr:ester cyclase [Chloroflexota bacterium]
MSKASRQRTMDRVIDDIIGKGEFDLVDDLFTKDFIWHAPSIELRGREQLKGLFADFRAAFPGRTYTYELQIHTGDYVIGRWVLEGVQKGPIMGVAPTGKPIRVTGITIHKFEGDRIAEEWEEFDGLGMLRQLGAIPQTL